MWLLALVAFAWLGASAAIARDVQLTEMFPINYSQEIMGLCFRDNVLYAAGMYNTLVKYDPSTGQKLGVIDPMIPGLSGSHIHGLTAAPRDTFWVADLATWQRVYHLRFSDYSLLSVVDAPLGSWIYGLAYQHDRLWIGRHSDGTFTTPIQAMNPTTEEIVGAFDLGSFDVHGLAWVGGYLWVLDNYTDAVYQVDCAGRICDEFVLPSDSWRSLGFDGTHFWTSNPTHFFRLDIPIPSTVTDCGVESELPEFHVCEVQIPSAPIPAVTEWGAISMTLLLLVAGTIAVRRARLSAHD
jgi:hypothetical protein